MILQITQANNITSNNFFAKKRNTSHITNNITRHNHNNYDHNVINQLLHITHINTYGTEIKYYNDKSFYKKTNLTFTMIPLILEIMK